MQKHWIDKLDVAQRQIKTAVSMFFREDDTVAIHTVIAAAHQVLFDIGKGEGIKSAIKNPKGLKPGEIQEHFRGINYPFNFFKHSERDSDAKINIGPLRRYTEDFILDAIIMLQRLTNHIPNEAKVYWTWYVSKYPEEFDNLPKDGEIGRMQKLKLADWKFEEIHQFLLFSNIIDPEIPFVKEGSDDPSKTRTRTGCWGWVKALFGPSKKRWE